MKAPSSRESEASAFVHANLRCHATDFAPLTEARGGASEPTVTKCAVLRQIAARILGDDTASLSRYVSASEGSILTDQEKRLVRITEAQAARFRTKGVGSRGKRSNLYNALVVFDAEGPDGATLRGVGECQFRSTKPGRRAKAAWETLAGSFAELPDVTLDLQLGADLEAQVDKGIEQILGGAADLDGFQGLRFGVESALLDLAAKANDCTLADVLARDGDVNRNVREIPLHAVIGKSHESITEQIVSMGLEGQEAWIDFGARFSRSISAAWVERLQQLVLDGVAASFVEYRPLTDDRRRFQSELAEVAAETNGLVSVARDVAHENATDRDQSLGTPSNRIVVRPTRLGGLLQASRLVDELLERGAEYVYVAVEAGSGAVGARAAVELAAACPGVRGLLIPTTKLVGNTSDLTWLLTADAVLYAGSEPLIGSRDEGFNLYEELPYLQVLGPNGTKGHLMERQALALGMDTIRYAKGAFTASDRVHEPVLFKWSRSPVSSAVSLSICTHKEATRVRLGRADVPVPQGRTFANGDWQTAKDFADEIGFPVVVKPAMGVRGIGVVAGIQDQEELDEALLQLSASKLGSQDFIVEKHIQGKDYRIVVVGDKVEAAILREPAQVIGDGKHSIAELILKKNAQRRLNPHLWGRPIIYDAASVYQLERLGLSPEDVPEDGRPIVLSNSSSLSQGGESFDVLDELHPSVVDACVNAVKAIPGLGFCGVDFLIEDHTKPLEGQDAAIVELNAHAAIGNCEYPLYGQPRQVARSLMKLIAERLDLNVPEEPAENITVRLEVRGRVTNVGYQDWFARLARSYGIDGWVADAGPRKVEAVLSGDAKAVSALAAAAVLGSPRSRPTSVTTAHVEEAVKPGFIVKRTRSLGDLRGAAKRVLRRAKRSIRDLEKKIGGASDD